MVSKLRSTLEIRLEGQASRRGLIPRTPGGERLFADAAAWLTPEYPEEVRSTRQHRLPSGDWELHVELHPAAPPLVLTASEAVPFVPTARPFRAGLATTDSSAVCSSAWAAS